MYERFVRDVDFVMRFERLQDDFNRALQEAGVPSALHIPLFNQTASRPRDYRSCYDDKTRRIVEYVYEAELARFGYQF